MPPDRRAAILKLIAELDQHVAESESLASNELLDPEERQAAGVCAEFYRRAAVRAERLLERVG
jgi:hypothetical protein